MLAEIGLAALFLAFLAALYAIGASVYGGRAHLDNWVVSARNAALLTFPLLLVSCGDGGGFADSSDDPPANGNHVWKSQTDMLDNARTVEDTVMEQSARERQTIDEMAR